MSLVQEPRLGGNTLSFADKCRKALAKKIGKLMDECEHQYFENAEKANCDMKLVRYVWDILLAPQKGYSFNRSHCLGYSLVALQEMNLAYKFPIIFWNTANLIVDSAGVQNSDDVDEDEGLEVESESEAEPEVETVDIYEPEDWEEYDYEDLPDRSAKKKTKNKTVDFGKVATAIGKFQLEGINIAPPNINVSDYTFTPMVKENSIASGLRNITRISADLVQKIIDNRPYASIEDFMGKVKVNKVQMINLLKCGAFDSLYPDRMRLIKQYIESISDTKSKLTLANVPMLIKYGCFEEEAAPYCRLYEFNKFVRKHLDQSKEYIVFPDKALQYYCHNYDADLLVDGNTLALKDWDKIYKKNIAPLAQFIKEDNTLLSKLNQKIVDEQMDIYAKGNISHFEMESISFYSHEHELEHVDKRLYGIVDYKNLPEEPIIDNQFTSKTGDIITTYKLFNIVGTVLNKNKIKNTVTILTPSGVANVKIYKTQFAKYDKQISEIGEDGKKHVMEKSWFSRGSLLMFQGFKRGDNFIPKAYKNSPHHCPIMKITDVEDRSIYYTDLRYDEL